MLAIEKEEEEEEGGGVRVLTATVLLPTQKMGAWQEQVRMTNRTQLFTQVPVRTQ